MPSPTTDRKCELYLKATITSLYHSLIEIDLHYVGDREQVIELDEPMAIAEVRDAKHARTDGKGLIRLTPGDDASSQISLSIQGGVEDTFWWNYPLMLGLCRFGCTLRGSAQATFLFVFPKYMHALDNLEKFTSSDGQRVTVEGSWLGYPEVQLSYAYRFEVDGEKRVLFETPFRENPITLITSVVLPYVVNLSVILVAFAWLPLRLLLGVDVSKTASIHILMVTAALPLYFTLWNFSNVLRAGPEFVNFLTTSLMITILTNITLAAIWVALGQDPNVTTLWLVWAGIIVIAGYLVLTVAIIHDTIRFLLKGHAIIEAYMRDKEEMDTGMLMFRIQTLLHKAYRRRLEAIRATKNVQK